MCVCVVRVLVCGPFLFVNDICYIFLQKQFDDAQKQNVKAMEDLKTKVGMPYWYLYTDR